MVQSELSIFRVLLPSITVVDNLFININTALNDKNTVYNISFTKLKIILEFIQTN